jgi:hypothetical protein
MGATVATIDGIAEEIIPAVIRECPARHLGAYSIIGSVDT